MPGRTGENKISSFQEIPTFYRFRADYCHFMYRTLSPSFSPSFPFLSSLLIICIPTLLSISFFFILSIPTIYLSFFSCSLSYLLFPPSYSLLLTTPTFHYIYHLLFLSLSPPSTFLFFPSPTPFYSFLSLTHLYPDFPLYLSSSLFIFIPIIYLSFFFSPTPIHSNSFPPIQPLPISPLSSPLLCLFFPLSHSFLSQLLPS